MDMEAKQLLTLALEALDRGEALGKLTHEQVDRLAGINANLLLLLKRADSQGANARLQMQAYINQILQGQNQILAIFGNAEALAGVVPREVLDKARQIKRKTTMALTGRDPAAQRKREDEITLVSFPLLHGGTKRIRMNRTLVKIVYAVIGVGLTVLCHKLGLPLPW